MVWSAAGTFVQDRGFGVDHIGFEHDFPGPFPNSDGRGLSTTAGILDRVVPEKRALVRPVDIEPESLVVLHDVVLEVNSMGGHGLRFGPPIDSTTRVADNGVASDDIVAVLVSNRHPMSLVAFEPIALGGAPSDAPTKEESIISISSGPASNHGGALGTASGMKSETAARLDHTFPDLDIVGLLEADAIAIVMAYDAPGDPRVVATVKEDAGGTATVDFGGVFNLIAVNGEIFDPGVFDVVAADDWEDRGCEGVIRNHAVGIQGACEGEVIVGGVENGSTSTVEIPHGFAANIDAASDAKAFGIFHCDGLLAEVSIRRQFGSGLALLPEHGLRPGTSHGHTASEME